MQTFAKKIFYPNNSLLQLIVEDEEKKFVYVGKIMPFKLFQVKFF